MNVIKNQLIEVYESSWRLLSKILSDESYIKLRYLVYVHKRCNLISPTTFNEKLNWMKLYYHNPLLPTLVDKYLVKDYVKGIIGDKYVVPNYGVWHSFDEIDFNTLPDKFVLKSTHDSGGATICKNKASFDYEHAREVFNHDLKVNYFNRTKEWAYNNADPKIIADMLLDDGSGRELRDYKFWCFNGVPKVMYITNKGTNIFENFYDMDFQVLDINHGFPRTEPEYEKPEAFELMKELAAKLSKGLPFVRIDFFYVDGNVFFGEYTFYDWAAFRPFKNKEWDVILGSWINLPQIEE